MATEVIEVRSEKDVAPAARRGARALRAGQLVGFATETVYGIAAAATIAEAMQRLRELKSRPKNPFSVHLGGSEDAWRYVKVKEAPASAKRLIERAWPGAVTLLLPTGGKLADPKLRRRAGLYETLCSEDVIGLRCPDEPVARAMLGEVSIPIVAPSANLAGRKPARTAEDVLADLDGRIDLLIDSGPARYGTDSTIVRCDAGGWSVLREGVFSASAIDRICRRTLLFVCTGNTCRSPMAWGLARKMLADRAGCTAEELPAHGVEVLSAGVFAGDGAPATAEAIAAAAEYGADIADHRSRKLTTELIREADLVFCMTESHVAGVICLAPGAAEKVRRLDPRRNVPDPIGGSLAVYRQTAQRIGRALQEASRKGVL